MVLASSKSRPVKWIFCAFAAHLVALLLFDIGMFPVKQMSSDNAEWRDYGLEPGTDAPLRYERVFKRVVVMLIDGIRADFVWNDRGRMPFTQSLLESQHGVGLVTLAQAPTVTLPRIKAILTGSVPVFSDAILNLQQSTSLSSDNILAYSKQHHGSNIVAYGDDIWGTLFPADGAFLRHEWVVSFFVSDFIDVDLNVTRHVTPELQSADWDILILHYLGLDHIGHFEGPTSSHVPGKLLEMDEIVKQVYETLDKDSVLLVLGDHGTGDAGGHGGSSAAEVRTPAMFFSPGINKHAAAATVLANPAGEVDQTDLASTLAVMLGVPIPKANMGTLISPMLSVLYADAPRSLLRVLAANTAQLLGAVNGSAVPGALKERFFARHASVSSLHAAYVERHMGGADPSLSISHVNKLVHDYQLLLDEASAALVKSSVLYDTSAISVGLFLLVSVFVLSLLFKLRPCVFRVLKAAPVLFVGSGVSVFVHVMICTSPSLSQSPWICSVSPMSTPVILVFFTAIVLNTAVLLSLTKSLFTDRSAWLNMVSPIAGMSARARALAVGGVVHLLFLSASSFVEEEHQVWYFLTTSLVLFSGIQNCVSGAGAGCAKLLPSQASPFILSLALLRLMRSWCQTGDKWLHLPDLSSWLAAEKRIVARSVTGALALVTVAAVFCVKFRQRHIPAWCLGLLLPGLLFAFLARLAMGSFAVPGVVAVLLSSDGYLESHVVYVLCIVIVCVQSSLSLLRALLGSGTTGDHCGLQVFYSVYLLLMCLITRAQNVLVVAALGVQHVLFDRYVWPSMSATQVAASSLWMGFAGFYMQGNSNAIAKIDLTPGYVGMRDFSPARVGVLITLSVWSSLLLWILAGFGHIVRRQYACRRPVSRPVECQPSVHRTPEYEAGGTNPREQQRQQHGSHVDEFLSTVMLYQMAIATVAALVTMAMRQHIMVWTVFSPKLLYTTSQSIHLICLLSAMLLSTFLSN
eukprot:scpid34275/ scgid14035/ GPI ethanolamine phosphate transferase 2; GPI7 homolog; Phosphatidylinositol-glycan biosynthesis class G protein